MYLRIFFISLFLFVSSLAAIEPDTLPESIDYDRHIKPLLSDRCYFCHGPDANDRKAGLRLDTEEGAKAAIGNERDRFAIVPGKPEKSLLVARTHETDPDEVMPPPEKGIDLSAREKALLKQWVAEGATWGKGHWAFQPLKKPEVPAVKSAWVKNDIDRFILKELEKKKLKPAPPISREKLLRRMSFDLTGLPPTLAELDRFAAHNQGGRSATEEPNDQAVDRELDRLLKSPHYGQRMAVDWLDASRYADTYGFQVDRDRQVWAWRDWVVKAFNDNLPYDQFITWQLAGDLLPDPTFEQRLATTFNRLHQQKVEGGSVPEEFRVEYVADRVHTVGTAMMGLTMECCRCHDHKYDPISMEDYYSMFAFFQNIDEAGLYSFFTGTEPTPALPMMDETQAARLTQLEDEVETKEAETTLALKTPQYGIAWTPGQLTPTNLPGVIAHFKFDEEKPGKHANRLDPKRPATTGGQNKVVDGKNGKAMHCSGDDAVKLPLGNFARHEPFSIACWIWTPDVKERAVVFSRSKAWTDAASRGYELLLESGKPSAALIHFYPGNAIRVRTVDPIPTQTWTHVTMSYDGSSRAAGLKLFINGQSVKTEVVRDKLTREITGGGSNNIVIGERMRDKGFKHGRVDDFIVMNRTATRVDAAILANGKWPEQIKLDSEDFYEFGQLSHPTEPTRKVLADLKAKRAERDKLRNSIRYIMTMEELPEPKPAYILERGLYNLRGRNVSANTPAALPPMAEDLPRNRLGLATWMTAPDHPLTARVFVNRIWQMHFGHGLVRTSEDFGSQGQLPTHPELLDWLCATFVESGWDIKALHKLILSSAAYRQSTHNPASEQMDPENQLLARGPLVRLPAEMLRDNALAISGLLDGKNSGGPVRPYDLEHSFKPSKATAGAGLYARSLYTYWKRTGPAPMMMTLNAVKRNVCSVKREATSSPLQALVLLNGTQFVEAARVLAEKLVADDKLDVVQAFRLTTSRVPDTRERALLETMYERQLAHYQAHPKEAEAYLNVGHTKPTSKAPKEQIAAAAVMISALMNFDECVMKR